MGAASILNHSPTVLPLLLTPAEAFAAITIAAIAADGYLATEEVEATVSTLARMHLFRDFSSETMQRLYQRLFAQLRQDGATRLLEAAVRSLPPELSASAYIIATDLILSDGFMTQAEQVLLNDLRRLLALSDETAHKIIEVMMLKNRG